MGSKELYDFVEDIKFDRLGVFTYSEEENTYSATHFKDDITQKEKQERADKIMELQRKISGQKNKKMVGKRIKVIIDRREGDFFIGRTEADSPEIDNEVLVKTNKSIKTGNFYQVSVTGADNYDLYAELNENQ